MNVPTEEVTLESDQMKMYRDMVTSFNKMSEICFTGCAHDFSTRKIMPKEEKCVENCMKKFMQVTQRVSQRFQEFQMASNEAALAAQNSGGSVS